MRLPIATAAAFLAFLSSSSAIQLSVLINPSALLPNPSVLPASTHASLHSSGPEIDVPLTRQNTFEFDNLTAGSYLLTVYSRDFIFEPLRVDVAGEPGKETVGVWQTFRGNEWDNKGEKRGEGRAGTGAPIVTEVRVVAPKEFYQERGGFNLLGFLKSPMILMALFSMAMIFGMPYLMENMDPETKAEFEEMQKASPLASANNPAAQLQNFDLASWMAGKTSGADKQQSSSSSRRKASN
ncbi:hypothetical protein M501DRAFT_1002792 [Patellaria atrata CBS 101060]|uniref:ER membrane protein complex subunit 7 beta-sandwich domain-containing protein n=1 Tax=Patellaria atrata CBS 101060 TaxID=1346257 RepID=A0A9P4SDM3_9PEZI|nr:hypothetical protein M501DRAFT_1002792 [Patellaria atrata CBS 101060]